MLLAVHLSSDCGHARIAYAVEAPPGAETGRARDSAAGLGRATPFLRARLAQQLDVKRLPKLSFTFVGVAELGVAP
jgi:ribosome-binding factor A